MATNGTERAMEMQAVESLRAWPAGRWLTDGSLDVVADINAQCIDFLVAMAEADVRHCPALFAGQAAFWRNLPARARQRLSGAPWLLVDGGFGDVARWRNLGQRVVHDLPAQPADVVFTGAGAGDFIRRVLVLGWHLARAERQLARVVLGMSSVCAEHIARLRLADLDWLAAHRPGWVRPRWERQPQVWRHLLLAARDPADGPLTHVSLRGLQLMAAGVLAAGSNALPRPRRD
jgi:hypothetical protein